MPLRFGAREGVQFCHPRLDISDAPAQVWVGRRVSPEPGSAAWEDVADSPRPWAVRTAGLPLLMLLQHCMELAVAHHHMLQQRTVMQTAAPPSTRTASWCRRSSAARCLCVVDCAGAPSTSAFAARSASAPL